MNNIVEQHIKELLFDHDCVVIPSLGGFICTYLGAEISISKNKISPPRKQIAFSDKLTSGDDLLINRLIEKESITKVEAELWVKNYRELVSTEINEHSQYTIEGLGRIYKNAESGFNFEQYLRYNFLPESYGLPDLYFKPIDRTSDNKKIYKPKNQILMASNIYNTPDDDETLDNHHDDEMEEVDMEELEQQRQQKKTESLAIYYVLAILALVLTTGTAYYLNMDKETYAIGSFNPFSFLQGDKNPTGDVENKLLPSEETGEASEYETNVQEESSEPQDDLNSAEPVTAITSAKAKPKPIEVQIDPENLISGPTGRFYIIAGGFRNKNKAATLLSTLLESGNQSKLLDTYREKGVYRVSIADFATYEEATAKKAEMLQSYGGDLWVLGY